MRALLRNTSLQTLDLSGNYIKIDDNVAKVIAQVLEQNTSLKILDLSDNEISDSALKIIAAALARNTSLTTLDLETDTHTDTSEAASINHQIQCFIRRNQLMAQDEKNATIRRKVVNAGTFFGGPESRLCRSTPTSSAPLGKTMIYYLNRLI